MRPLDVAVVGGSLGGLTVASLLRDDGHRVTVYERAGSALKERGAGIGFLPETYRYPVERIGISLDEISTATSIIRYLAADGSTAHESEHGYVFSSWNTVYRTLLGHWTHAGEDAECYRLAHDMTSFSNDDDGRVTVRFDGDRPSATVDLLVCADGVGSTARAALQPQAQQRYAGYVAWRGMVPESDLDPSTARLLGDAITYYVYPHSHILAYPIPGADGSVAPGRRLINFVWYRNYAEGAELTDLLTDGDGTLRTLSVPAGLVAERHRSEAWATAAARLPGPLAEVVQATTEPFIQVVYDIEVDRMAFGPVVLLGDAAFAVRPHAAAGTAKAAEDGWRLAAALASTDDLTLATARWEEGQLALGRQLLERTRSIGARSQVDNSWEMGDPELVFGLYRPGHP